MSELIQIPGVEVEDYYEEGAHWGTTPIKLSTTIMSRLVELQRLPADFEFRLLAFAEDERPKIAQTDILAALGIGAPSPKASEYLWGRLPHCVGLPSHVGNQRAILAQLDEHYYIQADLIEAAEKLGKMPYVARQSWERYVQIINYPLFNEIGAVLDPENKYSSRKQRYGHHMSRVAIRSDMLFDLYNDVAYMKQHGSIRSEILHQTLLDNYPEIDEIGYH